jgi:hypothetical protein
VSTASNSTSCLVCGSPALKNGRIAAGNQRWRCPTCGASSVRKRDDVTRRHQLTAFLSWLIGKHSQAEVDGLTGRSFRHATAWCWDVQPRLGPVVTTHHPVLTDGTGISSAVRQVWSATRTQRCLFHVQKNVRRHLTLNPRTNAGRRLRTLSLERCTVKTADDAIRWRFRLEAWWQAHGYLGEETLHRWARNMVQL